MQAGDSPTAHLISICRASVTKKSPVCKDIEKQNHTPRCSLIISEPEKVQHEAIASTTKSYNARVLA